MNNNIKQKCDTMNYNILHTYDVTRCKIILIRQMQNILDTTIYNRICDTMTYNIQNTCDTTIYSIIMIQWTKIYNIFVIPK